MRLPPTVQQEIETLAQTRDFSALRKSADLLSLRYRERSGHGARLATTELDALAYAASRMPATYASMRAALFALESPAAAPVRTALDVGAGTGAAALAAAERFSLENLVCLEREDAMRAR